MFGAASLALSSAATPAVLNGNALMTLGLVGFVIWLAFVTRVSVAFLGGRGSVHGSGVNTCQRFAMRTPCSIHRWLPAGR